MWKKIIDIVKKPLEFVQGPNNEYSSKRLFGLMSFYEAIDLAHKSAPAEVVAIFMAAATAVFISQAASRT